MLGHRPLNTAPLNSLPTTGPQTHTLAGSMSAIGIGACVLSLGLALIPVPAQAVAAGSCALTVNTNYFLSGSMAGVGAGTCTLTVSFPNGEYTDTILAEMARMQGAQPVTLLRYEFVTGDVFAGDEAFSITNWGGSTRDIRGWVKRGGKLDDVVTANLSDTPVLVGDLIMESLVPGGRDGTDTIWTRLTDARNVPEQTSVSLYLWFRNLNATTDPPVRIWQGIIQSWTWTNEQTLELTYADALEQYDTPVSRAITTTNFPNCDTDDIGKQEQLCYGDVTNIPCAAVDAGPNSPLSLDMTDVQTVLYYSQTSTGFASSGTIFLAAEECTYAGKTTEVLSGVTHGKLTGLTRGVNGTTASSYSKGTAVVQVQSAYKYLVAGHPMTAVSKVYVEDANGNPVLQAGTAYTVNLNDSGFPDAIPRTTINFTVYPKLVKQVNIELTDTIGVTQGIHQHGVSVLSTMRNDVAAGTFPSTQTGAAGWNFPPLPSGATFVSQVVTFQLSNVFSPSGASNCGRERNWYIGGNAITGVLPSSTVVVYSTNPSNGWGVTRDADFGGCGAVLTVQSITRTITYLYGTSTSSDTRPADGVVKTGTVVAGNSSADTVIGGLVTCDGQGYKDDSLGTYTGTPNALVQRSAHVMKHFLSTWMNVSPTLFRTSTNLSDKMGTTYQLNGLVQEPMKARTVASRMAFESGCWLKFQAGFATLIFRERYGPVSAVLTTRRLAFLQDGRQSAEVSQSPMDWLMNQVDARYSRDWRHPRSYAAYRQIDVRKDTASQSRYGLKARPDLFLLDFVTNQTQAQALAELTLGMYSTRRSLVAIRTRLHHLTTQFGNRVLLQDRMMPRLTGEVISADFSPGHAVNQQMPACDFLLFGIEEADHMWARQTKIANATLISPADQDTILDNSGAIGTVVLTLPAATVGMRFGPFYVATAQALRIDPNGSELFQLTFTSGSATDKTAPAAQTAGKYLGSATVGSLLMVACFEVGIWRTMLNHGAWTIEA